MNKTLLLIIIDFLFLNLIALTRWEKVEPARTPAPPVPAVGANAVSQDQDLVALMRQSLADEQAIQGQLEQKLAAAGLSLDQRERSLSAAREEGGRLAAALSESQRSAAELGREAATAAQDAAVSREELARLQRQLDEKRAEADREKQALDALGQQQAESRRQIEGLTVAVVVAEAEKQQLKEEADSLQTQVRSERTERAKVEQANVQLAQGVGQLAEKSRELTTEIRENRPINANVLYNDFLANRVETEFTAYRKGLFFGPVERSKKAFTVFTTDGKQVYALLHVEDTVFSFYEVGDDWERVGVRFDRSDDSTEGASIHFLAADPRIVAVPVSAEQAARLGAKVYPLAADPFKFPEALLVDGSGKGYGEVGFKLDPDQPGYVRVDNRFFKRIFGDFAPSRGDLVFSQSGDLLGLMVNSDYCALIRDFSPVRTIYTGDTSSQQTGRLLDDLSARVRSLPLPLQ